MAGRRIGYSDEVTSGSAKSQEAAGHLNTEAKERHATGTNSTKPHKHSKAAKGPFGKKGQPK